MSRAPTVLMTADAVGGVWSFALGLCRALPAMHFVLATLGPRPSPAQRAAALRLGNVRLVESDFRLEWMAAGQSDVAASRRWLAAVAERHRADLVHVNGYAQARLAGGRAVIAVAHSDVLSWWRAVHREAAPPEWDGYRREVEAGLRAAARVAAPTRAVIADLRRHYRVPLHGARVIANGVDTGGCTPRRKHPVVMAAGRVWDRAKNLRLLDEIAPELPWPVEIAGAAAHPESGVAGLRHARALGVLGPREMRRRLGEAALFAAPARYEPFGLGILEAAASGCALALGDIASLRENWDGAAVFVPAEDARAWVGALRALIRDPGQRARLAALARTRAARLTLRRTAAQYRALYGDLLGGAQRRVA